MSRLTELDHATTMFPSRCNRAVALACLAHAVFGCGGENDDPQSKSADVVSTAMSPEESAAEATAGAAADPRVSAESAAEDGAASAMWNAYAALGAGKYEALPDVITQLEAALESHPDDGRLALYAGTMHLWRATGRDAPLAEQFNDVNRALKLLERGHELSPDEPHIGAFLGITQMGFGNVANDDKWRAKGRNTLEDTIALYPPYVNGVLMQALGAVPRGHPYFADATKVVLAVFEGCGYSEAQRAGLDLRYPEQSVPGTCWNGGIVSHVWEGAMLIAGDIFAKAGDADSARHLYNSAKASPTYDHWPFGRELDRRIAEVDQRTALYLDGDDANDPPTWMDEHKLCVGCHADEP